MIDDDDIQEQIRSPLFCNNCGCYISDEEPCTFVRRIVLCLKCVKSNPLLGFE
jgi:hypothetical protein